MLFTNLTRQNEIGANCYYVQSNGEGYLLDCGSHPKIEGNQGLPRLDLLQGKPLDAVLISHAHLDHIGSLPVVLGNHPEARTCLTHATSLIADRALHNSASVMIKQRAELNLPEYPLYTHGQVDRIVRDFQLVSYGREVEIRNSKISFFEAGHVQGAAGVWIRNGKHSLFYTGDAKFSDMRITRGARFPDESPDTLVIECTRGRTPSQPDFSWENEIDRLTEEIQKTYERGGSVLIPCFALGKTQELLKVFYDLIQAGVFPNQAIYIGGLSSSYNEIYDELTHRHPRVCPGFKLEKELDLFVLDQKEGLTMKLGRGRLMLLSSGMMTPRTMSHAMAQRMVSDERHSIFFVGYVDPDSPAGKLKAAGQGGKMDFGEDIGEVEVRCRLDSFDLTSHCNREHMLDYVTRVRPRNVILVHGELESLQWFQEQLRSKLPHSKVIVPPSGEAIDLD